MLTKCRCYLIVFNRVKIIYYFYCFFCFIADISDSQVARMASLEDESSQNAWDDATDQELTADMTDGASSPNQITSSSVPSLTPEEE